MLEKSSGPHPRSQLSRQALSPTSVVIAGAGAAAGEALHLGIIGAIIFASAAWGARMAVASRALRSVNDLEVRDPWKLKEPWRSAASRAMKAGDRIGALVDRLTPGPTKDRIIEVRAVTLDAVREAWGLAELGNQMAGPDLPARIESLSTQLRETQQTTDLISPYPELRTTNEALLAQQLRAARGLEAAGRHALSELIGIGSKLEELASAIAELSLTQSGDTEEAIAALTTNISSLRNAREELVDHPPII